MTTEEKVLSGRDGATSDASIDMKLEVVVIPVSDVDRAKQFYARLGWRLDADFRFDNGFRVVQFTPEIRGDRTASKLRRPRNDLPGMPAVDQIAHEVAVASEHDQGNQRERNSKRQKDLAEHQGS